MKTRNEGKSGDQTFWISYADLMAGLMFVFMLIIGAVVVKYVLSQSDLAKLQKDLSEREKQIASSQSELVRKENVIKEIFSNLDRAKSENKELADINRLVNEMLEGVKKEKNELISKEIVKKGIFVYGMIISVKLQRILIISSDDVLE